MKCSIKDPGATGVALPGGTAARRRRGTAGLRGAVRRAPVFALVVFILVIVSGLAASGDDSSPAQGKNPAMDSPAPRTIIDLQEYRSERVLDIQTTEGKKGRISLINLNPNINAWYLLGISWDTGEKPTTIYHLENPHPRTRTIALEPGDPPAFVIREGERESRYDLRKQDLYDELERGIHSEPGYVPICGGMIYLRKPIKGHRTAIETVTDILRDNVRGSERLISFTKEKFFSDAYRDTARLAGTAGQARREASGPGPALVAQEHLNQLVTAPNLGIKVQGTSRPGFVLGLWYEAKDLPGVYVSLIQPDAIPQEVFQGPVRKLPPLDKVEATSLVYLVAFDLASFDLGFSLGTEHPRVGWSDRPPEQVIDKTMPGPDGIGDIKPLVSTGLLSPAHAVRTVATFAGGFKRTHGAFKYGALALKNHGSHYGFMENGVVFSRLQPGLSTLFVMEDGSVHMKTWSEGDIPMLPRIRYARQNGVPLIEFNEKEGKSFPGPLLDQWGPGNWGGSEDQKLRTLRAGAALQESDRGRYLIYALFTSATPPAMARVFQAYGCLYAMQLDINALEHTYLAVYTRQESSLNVQHLVTGMSEVDKTVKGQYVPRFLGFADNRDFFYVLSRAQ